MLGKRDELNFEQVWARKSEGGRLSARYLPGENQRIDFCLRYLPGGERFLDLGCGTGVLALQLKDRYKEVYGVDVAELPVKVARENQVEAVQLNLNAETLPYPDGFFDTITILSTLQYFYDLHFALAEIHRVLKAGGLIVLTVPNMRAFWRLGKLVFGGTFPKTSKDPVGYDGGALHYFCFSNIAALLEEKRFRMIYSGGIFCRPAFLNSIADSSILGPFKREFFSAEVVVAARKES